MKNQLMKNGKWVNKADGSGLIYGIVFPDNSFAPVYNESGDALEFDFNDDSFTLPGTDIEMNFDKINIIPDNQAKLFNKELIDKENIRLVSLVETNKFFKYVKDKEGPFFETATKATKGEEKFTIGFGSYGAKEGETITKKEAEKRLMSDIEKRIPEVINAIPEFENLSDALQQALFYEWFRGSLVQSPKTRKLINEGKFSEAAVEFLNNDEYRNAKKNKRSGIIKHMNLVAELLNKEGTI